MDQHLTKEIQVALEPIRARTLFVATPAYSNNMCSTYVRSMLDLQKTLHMYGIPHIVQFLFNESLISRARNKLAEMFLQSDATDLLFIDSDVEFEPNDVILLMHFNKEVIGGSYPLKSIAWDRVKRAVLKNPDIDPEDLAVAGSTWSAHCEGTSTEFNPFTPLEVTELATGFMMIKREVFEALRPGADKYTPPILEVGAANPGVDYFSVGVHGDRYESEDYSFCRKYRELGGKIWLCPWMRLNHYGAYGFKGNMHRAAEILGEIH